MNSIPYLKRMEELYNEDESSACRSVEERHAVKLAFELLRAIVARESFLKMSCPTEFDSLNALEELRSEATTRLMESISSWLSQISEGTTYEKARKSRAGSVRGSDKTSA